MSHTKLSTRAAARRKLKSKPVAIPRKFPEPESFNPADVESGKVPRFVWWASFASKHQRSIPKAQWQSATPEQQQFVRAAIESRGDVLFERRDRMIPIPADEVDLPLDLHPMRREYELSYTDSRIRNSSEIAFLVWNCGSLAEARRNVKEFLQDLANVSDDVGVSR